MTVPALLGAKRLAHLLGWMCRYVLSLVWRGGPPGTSTVLHAPHWSQQQRRTSPSTHTRSLEDASNSPSSATSSDSSLSSYSSSLLSPGSASSQHNASKLLMQCAFYSSCSSSPPSSHSHAHAHFSSSSATASYLSYKLAGVERRLLQLLNTRRQRVGALLATLGLLLLMFLLNWQLSNSSHYRYNYCRFQAIEATFLANQRKDPPRNWQHAASQSQPVDYLTAHRLNHKILLGNLQKHSEAISAHIDRMLKKSVQRHRHSTDTVNSVNSANSANSVNAATRESSNPKRNARSARFHRSSSSSSKQSFSSSSSRNREERSRFNKRREHGDGAQSVTIESPYCDPQINLILLVSSSFGEETRRNAIRITWGRWTNQQQNGVLDELFPKQTPERHFFNGNFSSWNIKLVFVIGRAVNDTPLHTAAAASPHQSSSHSSLQSSPSLQRLAIESQLFQDIHYDSSFSDDYQHLTKKTLSGIHWAVARCRHVLFYAKTDSDIFLNMPLLSELALQYESKARRGEKFILGNKQILAKVVRDRHEKWFIPEAYYRENVYPDYTNGPGYLISKSAARLIVLHTKWIHSSPQSNSNNAASLFLSFLMSNSKRVASSSSASLSHALPASKSPSISMSSSASSVASSAAFHSSSLRIKAKAHHPQFDWSMFIWEDVAVTGFLAENLHIQRINTNDAYLPFVYSKPRYNSTQFCHFTRIVLQHRIYARHLLDIWAQLIDPYRPACHTCNVQQLLPFLNL